MTVKLLALGVFCLAIFAETKTETDLRHQLAVSEAARLEVVKDKAMLDAALAKLTAHDIALARLTAQGAASSHSVTDQRSDAAAAAAVNAASASDVAAINAAAAQATAQTNAALAQQAAAAAATATLAAQQAAEHSNIALLITQVSGFLAILVGFFYTNLKETRNRRWALEDADRKTKEELVHRKAVIDTLAEVKEEAHSAYKEANTVNLKIASIGMRMRDDLPLDAHENAREEPPGQATESAEFRRPPKA